MAQRRRRNEQTNGVKNGSWGVSQKALDALESGTYGQMTGRKAKYRTSQEQTQQVNDLPALEGLFTEAKPQTWERKFGKSNVDTDRARRSYEQRIGHNASDFRDLRNKGYESTRRDFDFSDYDESLKANHRIDFGLFGNRGINELSALDTPNMPSIEYDMAHPEEISNAERQKYIDVFGAPMEDVIPAYQSYKKQWEQKYAEEHPIRVGLEDIGSAFERGNEATTNRIIDKFVKNEKVANALKRGTTSGLVDKVENKRDYVRNSDKLSDTQKSWLEALYGGGDFLSSTATGSLLTGGLGVANPETGFGLTVEPSKLVRGLVEAYNKFGLGKTQEYGALKRRGVSEEEAQKMSDYSGAVAGLTSGATAGLGGMGGNSGSAVKNAISAFLRSAALGGVTQTANEFAEKKILDDQSIYELSKQAYMEQGMSEEEAAKKADADRYGRIGGAAILNGVLGLGSNLLSQGVRGIKNALVPSESDPLNSVWATQPALEGETFPRLTGTVDNTQALSGSQYNVPALVDNIYPIQMPGTNGVIPMPGTNGVITPVVGGGSAPISNIADDIDWRVGSPRYVKKLEGADLEAATKQIADNNAAIGRIKNEIEIIKGDKGNYYRGKLKKAVQTDIANREKEIKKIEGNTKELTHQVNGGLKPMLDMLTTEQKNGIYSVNGKHDSVFSDINFMAKFAGDTPEAKKLAKTAQNAISRYVRTGDVNEVKTMTDALMELDQMAKATNAMWTSSKGNEWTYGQRFGEQAKPLYNLKPVTDIYNLERALEKAAGRTAKSTPVEAPQGIQVYRGYNRSDNPLERNLAKQKTIYDFIGNKDANPENKIDMLPLEFYTDSEEDAWNYANHDKDFYDSLRIMARGDLIRAYERGENILDEEAFIKNRMDEAYRTLTGREPVFDGGHVDTHTINPKNILDLSELDEITSIYDAYKALSQIAGINESELDDILRLGALSEDRYDEIPTYSLLRNYGDGEGAVGSRFVDFMRNNGYDAVKYKESGANHYALLNDQGTGASVPVNDNSYAVPNQYRKENGAIKVGRATKVRAEYTGDTSKLPVQSKQNTDRYSIPDETFNRALQKFDDAINGETEGKSAKSILTRVYKDIFAERKKEAGTEHINVPIKNIKDSKGNDYTVSITSDAVGKAFNSQFIPEKVAVLDDLPNIINKSTYVGSADPVAKKGIERYDYFEKLAHINGKDYVVTFAVEIQPNINKYRTHALIDEIKIQQTSGNIGTGNDPSMPSPNVAEFSNEIVPQIPQNVNATQPNFTTVGQPYTPQEVPNVQPTPPTPEPPQPEVPNMDGGKEKTSQYYKNTMRGTETNRDMSDTEYADRFDEELFKRMTIPEQQSVNMGRNFIKESGGRDAAIERLLSGDFDSEERFSGFHIDAAEMLANDLERQALELEKMGQDASDLWRKANRLHKKIQLNASDFGVGMQALQKWKKSTPQGAYDDLVSQINKGIDKKKTTGYTRNVNDLADKIEDAIANSNSKEDLLSKIREIFGKNRENSDYNTKKAEQQVLDLVGGSKNNKKSITDLAEEASRIIKKEMGVSTLTPREERAVLNLLDAASQVEPGTRAYNELVSQAMVIVDESLPSSMGEKFKSLLYDNMLASIKTMFTRNFGGNVVGNAIDAMAAPFQVGADAIVGKFTGARTRSLTGKSIIAAAKGLGHGFKDWGQDIGYSLKNKTAFNTARSGQESLADVLQAVHKTWKTQSQNKAVKAVHNALSAYDYVIRKGMEGGDRPIYEAQYAATKAELYDVVDKYGDAGIRKGLPADKRDLDTDDLIEAMAINEGLEAVLQNDSKMKEAAKNLKAFFKKSSEDMLGIDIASMSHAPFVEVPANMASNFFKLTPIGWAGNIARTIGEKKKYGSINQRRFTGELGLNVLGGLLIGGGVAAADKFISGPYSEDKDEKKLQQNNGYLEYALQTPDESTQVDISDIPYLGPMLKFAKTERDAYKENGLEGALSAVPSAASAATVDTLYQALNRLTGADFQYNGNGNLISNAVSNIKSSVGSMGVPSVVRQTAQFTDPYKRDLGDYGTDEYNKNLIINGIPGLRQTMLEPKIDTAGQPVPELGGATGIRRFLSAYVSPYKVSHPHENTSAVQEYANMLKLATEGAVNPQMKVINASDLKKIKGYDAENYSHADLRELQEDYYKSNTELGNALINDPWFTNLSYEKQGELLDQLWSANKALVSEEFVRKGLTPEQIEAKGDELYTTDNKLAGIIRDDDEKHTGLLKWLKDETSRDEVNAKYGTEMSHDDYVKYNEREEGYAEQRASEAAKAKALGMSVDNYEKYEAEYEGGAQGRYDDVEAAKQYGFVDANKNANTDAYNIAKQLGNGDTTVIQAYSDYKKQGYNSNAYGAKASYLVDEDRFTPTQKGMIIVGSQDGTLKGKVASGARNAFDIGNSNGKNDGYAGIYYYYLLKNMADADNSGSVTKKEREAFIAGDNRYLDELWNLNQDMYNYLAANLK